MSKDVVEEIYSLILGLFPGNAAKRRYKNDLIHTEVDITLPGNTVKFVGLSFDEHIVIANGREGH